MMVSKIILIFKFIEPLFWFSQALIVVNLLKPKYFFECNVKILNRLLGYQGFDSEIKLTDKALKIWHRDLWILLFLNPLIIFLIHLI